MVDRTDLHAGRASLSAVADGGFYCAPCSSASIVRAPRAGGYAACDTSHAEPVARISRLNFNYRLRGFCPRLCCRRNVSRARATAENARVTIDFLPSAAPADAVLGHDAAALAWIRALYRGLDQRIFHWRARAVDKSRAGGRDLGFVRRDFAGPIPSLIYSAPHRRTLCRGVCSGAFAVVEH